MGNLIPFELWQPLNDKVQKLNQSSKTLGRYFDLKNSPPQEVLLTYFNEFKDLLKIIEETRSKSAELTGFLDHDFNNFITPLCLMMNAVERANYKRNLNLVQSNLYINRIVKHVIGSIKYFVDGKLETHPVGLTEFMLNEKKALEKIFGKTNKLEFFLENEFIVNINEDTMANILLNIAKNARYHGQADALIFLAIDKDEYVHFYVFDNGIGIDTLPVEENPHGIVTDVLKCGVSRRGGKGLGLADLQERMQAMGGTVTCYGHGGVWKKDKNTRGTQFFFKLKKFTH